MIKGEIRASKQRVDDEIKPDPCNMLRAACNN